jgi:hypothetical protein
MPTHTAASLADLVLIPVERKRLAEVYALLDGTEPDDRPDASVALVADCIDVAPEKGWKSMTYMAAAEQANRFVPVQEVADHLGISTKQLSGVVGPMNKAAKAAGIEPLLTSRVRRTSGVPTRGFRISPRVAELVEAARAERVRRNTIRARHRRIAGG